MIITVCKKFRFDAAHYLPNYKGKCHNLHGHGWVLEVEVSGEVSMESGLVLDFSTLKEIVQPVINCLDHSNLNDILSNPTCENILEYLWINLGTKIGYEIEGNLNLSRLRLYETPDSYAEVKGDD